MADRPENGSAPPPAAARWKRVLKWTGAILGILLLLLFIASFFLDEPLRRMAERKLNSSLKDYTVRVPSLHLQLIGLRLTLKQVSITQKKHPDPAIALFPEMVASIHWREILSGRLVAELTLEQPRLNVNLPQLREETGKKESIKERGWQQALQEIYPLKINLVTVRNGSITYIDQDPKRPLSLSALNFQANNIRNIHLPDKVYPSPFHLDARIFGSGRGSIDGRANFLAEPHLGLKGNFKLEKVPIDYFKPVLARSNLAIEGGILNAAGSAEYAPNVTRGHLTDLEISGLNGDYVHSARTAHKERQRGQATKKTAKEVSNKEGLLLRIDRFRLTDSRFGMHNQAAPVPYRLFLSDADITMTNLSNHFSEGPAEAKLKGKFMGSGATTATVTFRPEEKGPDLDLFLKIDDTQLKSLNDLLRSYGNFDVVAGFFSLVTELHVKNNRVDGYIKPFFRDMQVYDKRQDKEKGVFRKMYEMLVGGVARLMENRPREEVATKADIAGPLEKPQTSSWQVIVELVRNAFIKAILPTFEREVSGAARKR